MPTHRITGLLLEPAHTATGTDGSAWLRVRLEQTAGAPACVALRCYGSGPAAQFSAGNAAHRLRRGTLVTVHAEVVRIAHSPEPHLVLEGVDLIEQHGMPVPHHQTTAETA
jgi:hypothetical protein